MARKVYMSVLGTGFYKTVTYAGRGCSTETRFVQEATLRDIGVDDWGAEDAVYILLTEKARSANWDKNIGERKDRNGNSVAYSRLELVLERMNLRCAVKDIDICDGKDESEMWEIFSRIYSLLEEGDELYFDLTLGFRSLPMLLLVLGNYAKFLKNTKIVYLSYGNYEALKDGVAPIVDLLPLAALQDWTTAAGAFRETGRVDVLCSFLKGIASDTADRKFKGHLLKLLTNLESFQLQSETCCGKQICDGETAGEVAAYIEYVIKDGFLPDPVRPILLSIKDEAVPFAGKKTDNIREAVLRCKKYGLIQQGYTMCQEGIVTIICDKFSDLNPFTEGKRNENYRKYRDYWSSILGIPDKDKSDSAKWKPILKGNSELTRSIFALDWVGELRKKYSKLTGGRNHVNHGGFTGNLTALEIKEEFIGIVDEFIDFCGWELERPKPASSPKPPVFINLSNHPLAGWSEKQLAAAREYGDPLELPFPAVSPEIGEEELKGLVDEYSAKVRDLAEGKTATVHIMGEMTFTYVLVQRLKECGIRCVASTSERVAEENPDGTKLSSFSFVRFRDY